MQTLVELDAVKQRMLESQRALKEADNWTTLLTDVEEVFASQDIDKVCGRCLNRLYIFKSDLFSFFDFVDCRKAGRHATEFGESVKNYSDH